MNGPMNAPSSGQELLPYLQNSAMWREISDTVNEFRRFKGRGSLSSQLNTEYQPFLRQTTGDPKDAGTVVNLTTALQPPNPRRVMGFSPIFNVQAPTWTGTGLAKLHLLQQTLSTGVKSPMKTQRYFAAEITRDQTSDGWAMVDPTDPTKLKSADAGLWKILDFLGSSDEWAILDLYESQPIWRFEKNGSNFDLLRRDGTVYKASVSLIQSASGGSPSGTEGQCFFSGGKFVVFEGATTKLCKTPVGGIGAMTGAGTVGDPYVFGSATCELIDVSTGIASGTGDVAVRNSTTLDIPGGVVIQVKQIGGLDFVDVVSGCGT